MVLNGIPQLPIDISSSIGKFWTKICLEENTIPKIKNAYNPIIKSVFKCLFLEIDNTNANNPAKAKHHLCTIHIGQG
jgi:hypothetical protein